jgi:hypothetical protein
MPRRETIERLRASGVKRMTVFSPVPSHDLEHALHAGESPVRMFTLVGGLTGAATGFAMPTWMSMDWPLVTGGKPIISLPAWVIMAFELTILFGALSTVAGLFINARLPQRRIMQVYDPSFSSDRFGVLVMPPRQGGRGARHHARQRRGRDPRAGGGGEGWRPLDVTRRTGPQRHRLSCCWPLAAATGCTRSTTRWRRCRSSRSCGLRRRSIRTSTRCRRRPEPSRSSRRTAASCCRRSRRRSRR